MKTEADKNNDGKDDITGAEVKRKGAFAQGFAKGYSKTSKVLDPNSPKNLATYLKKKITTPDKDLPNKKKAGQATEEIAKMKVTAADKRANTPAYKRMKAGDPRYIDATNETMKDRDAYDVATKKPTKKPTLPKAPWDKKKDDVKEGLADKADMAERDHEVQMARADLYKIAKYAIELHDMMKKVTEADGIEGWQQAKITKAADYMGSVFHSLDYDLRFNETEQQFEEGKKSPHKKGTKKYKDHMAAMHAESASDPYKQALSDKLNEAKGICNKCSKPSYTTLPEEKQKGVDGKVCWKGYKRMGTKQKGGKTVDNCVKA
jgi:hypothetical protein